MSMLARVNISFQVTLRVASRLQCSLASICARTASETPTAAGHGRFHCQWGPVHHTPARRPAALTAAPTGRTIHLSKDDRRYVCQ